MRELGEKFLVVRGVAEEEDKLERIIDSALSITSTPLECESTVEKKFN